MLFPLLIVFEIYGIFEILFSGKRITNFRVLLRLAFSDVWWPIRHRQAGSVFVRREQRFGLARQQGCAGNFFIFCLKIMSFPSVSLPSTSWQRRSSSVELDDQHSEGVGQIYEVCSLQLWTMHYLKDTTFWITSWKVFSSGKKKNFRVREEDGSLSANLYRVEFTLDADCPCSVQILFNARELYQDGEIQ